MIREMSYFWAARTLSRKVVYQYTFEGDEQKWSDVLEDFGKSIIRIYWLPFDHELAANMIHKRVAFWPKVTNNPVLWLDIPPGKTGIPMFTIDHEKFSYWRCEQCKGTIALIDPTKELICPHCESKNEWFCYHCQKVIDKPLFRPKGKVECPTCLEERNEPYGLVRTKSLTRHTEMLYFANYTLAINNEFGMQYDDCGRFVRKYKVGNLI